MLWHTIFYAQSEPLIIKGIMRSAPMVAKMDALAFILRAAQQQVTLPYLLQYADRVPLDRPLPVVAIDEHGSFKLGEIEVTPAYHLCDSGKLPIPTYGTCLGETGDWDPSGDHVHIDDEGRMIYFRDGQVSTSEADLQWWNAESKNLV